MADVAIGLVSMDGESLATLRLKASSTEAELADAVAAAVPSQQGKRIDKLLYGDGVIDRKGTKSLAALALNDAVVHVIFCAHLVGSYCHGRQKNRQWLTIAADGNFVYADTHEGTCLRHVFSGTWCCPEGSSDVVLNSSHVYGYRHLRGETQEGNLPWNSLQIPANAQVEDSDKSFTFNVLDDESLLCITRTGQWQDWRRC